MISGASRFSLQAVNALKNPKKTSRRIIIGFHLCYKNALDFDLLPALLFFIKSARSFAPLKTKSFVPINIPPYVKVIF
jgi:hypothetical protein